MTGTLRVNTKAILPDELRERVHEAVEILRSHGIKVLEEQAGASLEAAILIDLIEMGDISHEHIKPFLLTLFPKARKIKGVTALVRDSKENKRFEMPSDIEECVDWFRIE